MNNDEVLHDFRRRYERTYVHLELHAEQREVLAYVESVNHNEEKIGVMNISTVEYGTLQLNLGSEGHTLRFKYPPVGVFQNGFQAHIFFRKPARQYRRGLCSDNSSIITTSRLLGGNSSSFGFDSLQNAFEHRTYSVNIAIGLLTQKHTRYRSVALPDNLSLMASIFENKPHILIVLDI